MGKIRGLDGTLIDDPKTGSIAIEAEMLLNLVARVQNLEAVVIMIAQLAQKDMTVAASSELDLVMEAFYQAQTKRGASHLSRELTDDNPAIFI